jgi:hypothetical protein
MIRKGEVMQIFFDHGIDYLFTLSTGKGRMKTPRGLDFCQAHKGFKV